MILKLHLKIVKMHLDLFVDDDDHDPFIINLFTVICAMFLTGQNCLFQTLVAVCDPALGLHAHSRRMCKVRTPGRRRQRVFEINNFAPSKTWRILP